MKNILFFLISLNSYLRLSVVPEDAFGKYKAPTAKDLTALDNLSTGSNFLRAEDLNEKQTHICIVGEDDPDGNDYSTLLVSTANGTKEARLYHDKREKAKLSEGDHAVANFKLRNGYVNVGRIKPKS